MEDLRRLAEAATPETKGRWRYHRSIFDPKDVQNYAYVEWGDADFGYGTGTLSQTMARYLAALSPDRVLALLDRLAALTSAVDAALRELGVPSAEYPAPVANAVAILRAVVE